MEKWDRGAIAYPTPHWCNNITVADYPLSPSPDEDASMNAAEKRRARRFPMTLPVAVRAEEVGKGELKVQTRDISSSGVYFEFATPLDIGTALEFVLTLPEEITKGSSVRIKCVGKVVRVDRPRESSQIGVAATIERYEFLREN